MPQRRQHQRHVLAFLEAHTGRSWTLSLPPHGRGNETYIARAGDTTLFVKLKAQVEFSRAMAELGVTPPVVTSGKLADKTPILVQEGINGRMPSWSDFRRYLPEIAAVIKRTHNSEAVKHVLAPVESESYANAGLAQLARIQSRWTRYRDKLYAAAKFVDESLAYLERQARSFDGGGLAASHNDVCNGNWLIASDGKVYLVDLEAMSRDDPARDLGALLWWYYPPDCRARFLEIAGYPDDEAFRHRMRVRMAMHCLDVLLPREKSFDRLNPSLFAGALVDFRAVLVGKENPRGYEDRKITAIGKVELLKG